MNQAITFRPATVADFTAICAINLADIQHTSAMDAERLQLLDALACYHTVACVEEQVAAFLLAMQHGAAYHNPNFDWFSQRFSEFIYIDRIVVSQYFRGLGLASLLYDDLFRYAQHRKISPICCEYNAVPANEPSRLFHEKFGFKELGRQWLANGEKQVSMVAVEIDLSF